MAWKVVVFNIDPYNVPYPWVEYSGLTFSNPDWPEPGFYPQPHNQLVYLLPIPFKIMSVSVNCFLSTISIEVAGGVPPYEYSIDNGVTFSAPTTSTVYIFSDISSGYYDIYVRDSEGSIYRWERIYCNNIKVTFEPVYLTPISTGDINGHTVAFDIYGDLNTTYAALATTTNSTLFYGWSLDKPDRFTYNSGWPLISSLNEYTHTFLSTNDSIVIYGIFYKDGPSSQEFCFYPSESGYIATQPDIDNYCATCDLHKTVYFNTYDYITYGIANIVWYLDPELSIFVESGYYKAFGITCALYRLGGGITYDGGTCCVDPIDDCNQTITTTTTTGVPTTTTTTLSPTTTTTTLTPTTTTTTTEISTTTTTTTIIVLNTSVLFNTGDSPTLIYAYYPNNLPPTSSLLTVPSISIASTDIAHTSNKLWIYYASNIDEWNITLDPWTATYNKQITNFAASPGLCAINDTKLIGISYPNVYECDVTTTTSNNTLIFTSLIPDRYVSGDYILTTTNKLIVTTHNLINNTWISQYSYPSGELEVDIDISSTIDYPYGLYEYDSKIYIANDDGKIYEIDRNSPYTLTLVDSVTYTIYGASQLPSSLTVHFELLTTTTTTAITTTTTTTETSNTTTTTTAMNDATIMIGGYSGYYDGNYHGATGTATGIYSEDLSAYLYLGEQYIDPPGGMANWTFSGAPGYYEQSGSISITIHAI